MHTDALLEHDGSIAALDTENGAVVFRVGGSFIFPSMNDLRETVLRIQHKYEAQTIVLDCQLATAIDFTGAAVRARG